DDVVRGVADVDRPPGPVPIGPVQSAGRGVDAPDRPPALERVPVDRGVPRPDPIRANAGPARSDADLPVVAGLAGAVAHPGGIGARSRHTEVRRGRWMQLLDELVVDQAAALIAVEDEI